MTENGNKTTNGQRIVFFGTPEFAVPSLDALVKNGFDVAAVVTATDKPAGRGHKLLPSAVKQYALDHDIEVLQPEKLRDEAFLARLREIGADLFIVIAFRMMPEVVWSMPRLGTFNLHGSLLPAYRGAAPINWAVINGETKTGVTTFFLSHEIDTGDIIDTRSIDIAPNENAGSVHDRLMEAGAELTLSTARAIFDGTISVTPQIEIIERYGITPSPAPKIFRDTCRIDWTRDAISIHNFVRGLAPYPAAVATLLVDGKETDVKILETEVDYTSLHSRILSGDLDSDITRAIPGHVERFIDHVTLRPALRVTTGHGRLLITRLQLPGKRPVTPLDLANGKINISSRI